jgi:hypothetical protein
MEGTMQFGFCRKLRFPYLYYLKKLKWFFIRVCLCLSVDLTEIFLSLNQLRKVQLQFKKKCNSVQLHISGRKVQLYFFDRKVQLKCIFVSD